MIKKSRLDNGLRVVTQAMPKMRSVSLGIWINVGGRYESVQNKGISHIMEHLLFKGSKKYSCYKLKESIEGIGGSLNGFTSEEFTCYLVKIPGRHLNTALDVLSDMVINPLLDEAEVEKEKQVILEEIKMYRDQPQSYVLELLDDLLWPGQPLGMPVIGTADSVSSVRRNDLVSFKNKYYTPDNIVVSAAGLLGHGDLVKRVEKIFSTSKRSGLNEFSAVIEGQDKPQLNIFSKDTEQTHLALGFHGFKRDHPLKYALSLLHVILGGNMSSRLFNELREKRGLAYEIGAGTRRFNDTGVFLVHAGIDNRKVGEAVSLILNELSKAKSALAGTDEFKRAKEFYLGQLTLSLEETMDNMLSMGESIAALDKTYTPEEIIEGVEKVKRQDLRAAAGEIFRTEKINLALIGPVKDKESEIYPQLRLE